MTVKVDVVASTSVRSASMQILDALKYLQQTPLPTILVVAGIVFLLLALAGGITGQITIPRERQKWSAVIGGVLLVVGILIQVIPGLPAARPEPVAARPPAVPERPAPAAGREPPTPERPAPGVERPPIARAGPTAREADEDESAETTLPRPPRTPPEDLATQIYRLQEKGNQHLQQGELAKASEDFSDASRLLDEAYEQSPNDLNILMGRGYLMKDWAQVCLSMSEKLSDEGQRSRYVKLARDYLSDSEAAFQKILKHRAGDSVLASARNGLGSVSIVRSLLDLAGEDRDQAMRNVLIAEKWINAALETAPDYDVARRDLERAHRLKAVILESAGRREEEP